MGSSATRKQASMKQNYGSFLHSMKGILELIAFFLLTFTTVHLGANVIAPWVIKLDSNETLWTRTWESIYNYFDGNHYYMVVVGTTLAFNGTFWLVGLLYLFLDLTGKPYFLTRYKTQPDKNNPVKFNQLKFLLIQICINQTIVWIPVVLGWYYVMEICGCKFGEQLPEFSTVVKELLVFIFFEEIGFYYSHRFLHLPIIYKYIHKRHHEWTAPIAISAIYAHPIEHVLSNVIPGTIGPLIMKSHITTVYIWIIITIIGTMNQHSGYHIPFTPSNEFHDFHHLTFNYNYGAVGILDLLHGTDSLFKKNPASKRHYILLGLTPVRSLIPEIKSK